MRLPDFLIIGAPRSGTTSLAAHLNARSDVFVPVQKELHFFNRDDRFTAGIGTYARPFARAGGRQLCGEATPNYLAGHAVPARVAEVLPHARLIAVLREPADRAWSHFAYDAELGRTEQSFADIVASAGTASEHPYVTQGRYVQHLERWTDYFPRDQLLVLWFDDLRDRPDETFRMASRFLGLGDVAVPSAVGGVHNAHYRLRAPWVRAAMIRWRAWRRLPFGLAPRIDRLLQVPVSYRALDERLRVELRAAYSSDNAALAAWLGQSAPDGWS